MAGKEREIEAGLLAISQQKIPVHHTSQCPQQTSSLLSSLRNDRHFRRRFVRTIAVTYLFLMMGWIINSVGSTLPDLRQIVRVSLETASWLLTFGALGSLVGSIMGGYLFDRYNKLTILAGCGAGIAMSTFLMPVFHWFAVMLIVKFINECFIGALNTGANAYLPFLWGSDCAPYMQMLHFGVGLGSILGTLISEPFLSKSKFLGQVHDFQSNCSAINCNAINCSAINYSFNVTFQTAMLPESESRVEGNELNATLDDVLRINRNGSLSSTMTEYDNELIYFAFITPSVLVLIASTFLFSLKFCFSSTEELPAVMSSQSQTRHIDDGSRSPLPQLSVKQKIVFLSLVSGLSSLLHGVEKCYSQFFMTFMTTYIRTTKMTASLMASSFWIGFAVGRFTSIFVSHRFRPRNILYICTMFLFLSFVGFIISVIHDILPLVWLFNISSGLALSITVPTMYTWTATEILRMTGKVTAAILVVLNLYSMAMPLVFGNLMERFSQLWFAYLLAIQSGLSLINCLVISFMLSRATRAEA